MSVCFDCKWPHGSKVEQLCPCHAADLNAWESTQREQYEQALAEAREQQRLSGSGRPYAEDDEK